MGLLFENRSRLDWVLFFGPHQIPPFLSHGVASNAEFGPRTETIQKSFLMIPLLLIHQFFLQIQLSQKVKIEWILGYSNLIQIFRIIYNLFAKFRMSICILAVI